MAARTICFVTDELYPFTSGGLGRLLYNLFKDAVDKSTQCHLLMPLERRQTITPEAVRREFGGNFHAHYVDFRGGASPELRDGLVFAPPGSFGYAKAFRRSYAIYRALARITREQGLRFDYIEFPDFFGPGFCTIQARLLGDDFADTKIAVRLHSTISVIGDFEGTFHTWDGLVTAELERKALHDADIVVAHLADIAAFNRRFYDFGECWMKKVVVQRPPVSLDGIADNERAPAAKGRIGFTGRIQRFKRPDLFVKGCELFFHANPHSPARAVFACHVQDRDLLADALAGVTADLRTRFASDAEARGAIVSGEIVAITSDYESYCLAAYETSRLGGILVLNASCIAFNEKSGWQDGVNCIKFDGTAAGLAGALERAVATDTLEPFAPAPGTPYWQTAAAAKNEIATKTKKAAKPRKGRGGTIGVSIVHGAQTDDLAGTLASLAAYDGKLEIAVCRAAAARNASAPDRRKGMRVQLLDFPGSAGEGVMRTASLAALKADYILLLHAGDRVSPSFLGRAVSCLDASPGYDGVVPQSAVYRADEAGALDQLSGWSAYLGDAPTLSLVRNKIAGPGFLVRRKTLRRAGFDEELPAFVNWSVLATMTLAGARFVVTNTTDLYCQHGRDDFDADFGEFWTRFHRGNALKRIDARDMVRPKYLLRAFQTEMVSDTYWQQVGAGLKRPAHIRVRREIERFFNKMSRRRARRVTPPA